MAMSLFGFNIGRKKDLGTPSTEPAPVLQKGPESFVAPETFDGTYTFENS